MGLLTPLAVRIGAIPWMPKLLPQIVAVDKALQRVGRGRVSILDVAGLPNLALTVPGRKSGIPRTTPLLCVPHDGGWLIAGSYFGGPRDARCWVNNLRATGHGRSIRLEGARGRSPVTRREDRRRRAGTGCGRSMLRTWPNFGRSYEERTDGRGSRVRSTWDPPRRLGYRWLSSSRRVRSRPTLDGRSGRRRRRIRCADFEAHR